MVWNLMEGNKEGNISNMDVGEATSLSLGHVAAFNSARPSAKARSSRPRLERPMCKAHALKEGSSGAPFQVGGKKRGYANEIVGASLGNKSVTLLTRPKENPRRKRAKLTEESINNANIIQVVAVMQPHHPQ
jgi:hypothetical protein